MNKQLKEDLRDLRALASQLPITYYKGNGVKICRGALGSEILEKDPLFVDEDEKKLDKNKEYFLPIDNKVMVNDFRRLKKIYKSKGIEGVRHYVNEVVELNTKKETFGGLTLMNE